MVRHGRKTHSTKEDAVIVAQRLESVSGHHLAVLQVIGAPPGESVIAQRQPTVHLTEHIQRRLGLVDGINAYAVPWNHCDPVLVHTCLLYGE